MAVSLLLLALGGCSYDSLTLKQFDHPDEHVASIQADPNALTIVLLRPNSFFYYGYDIDVYMNDTKEVALKNQSFSVVKMPLDSVLVRGQSGLLGPHTKTIRVESHLGQVVYLSWENKTDYTDYTPVGPIVHFDWRIVSNDQANADLKALQYVHPAPEGK